MQETRQTEEERQLSAFTRELANRLASLDRGEHLDPKSVRERLQQKSRDRRKLKLKEN